MRSFLSSEALARASASHPWRTIGIWVVLIVAAMGLNATFLADSLTTEFYFLNNPDSQRADTPLEERLRGPRKAAEVIVVQHPDLTVENDDFENRVTSIWDEVTALEAEGTPKARRSPLRRPIRSWPTASTTICSKTRL